jgi:hypothetical protein
MARDPRCTRAVLLFQAALLGACSAEIIPPGGEDTGGTAGTSNAGVAGSQQAGAAGRAGAPSGSGGASGAQTGSGGSGSTASAGSGGSGSRAGQGGTGGSGGSAGRAGAGGSGSGSGSGGTGSGSGSGGSGSGGGLPPSLANCPIFPASSPWNTDISGYPLHPNSNNFINSIGRTETMHPDFGTQWEGAPIGIPYVVVPGSETRRPIQFVAYGDESDPGPYPIPLSAPIEGGPSGSGDRHVIAIDSGACKLYELFAAYPNGSGWRADSGAVWDLRTNASRPLGWTSADAAGMPVFPGLVRYDEVVEKRVIQHALRFTVRLSRAAYVAPATHYASNSTDANLPPMGLRLRMKAGYSCSSYSSEVQVICTALKRYGMFVADNGSDWYLSGAPDPRWSDDRLRDVKRISGDAFEVVDTGPIRTY